jgi:sec-independent protein translocase protein TatA
MSPLFAFGFGPMEMIGIGIVGVLLFGRKLPEVGKYLGQSIVQFKKGMKGLEDEIDGGMSPSAPVQAAPPQPLTPPQRVAATAPKFQDAPANPPQV